MDLSEQIIAIQTDNGFRLVRREFVTAGGGIVTASGKPVTAHVPVEGPDLLLQAQITTPVAKTDDGPAITACAIPWQAIFEELRADPSFLAQFAKNPRAFEEFLAASYDKAGFDEVVLTPNSGDLGRDVIAIKRGIVTVKILDQAKAYSPGNKVTANDVRALLGVLSSNSDASKGVITTTSDFAPGVSAEFAPFTPYRLETKNGPQLIEWLRGIHREVKEV